MQTNTTNCDILLSIIIPSHGRQDSLDQLVGHLATQSGSNSDDLPNIELIVIDDGSNTPLTKRNTADSSLFIQWLRLEKKQGAPAARKYGFNASRGRFIHFHDSDDDIGPGWLASTFKILQDNNELDLLISARKVVSHEGEQFKQQDYVKQNASRPHKIRQRLQYNNCLGPLGGLTFSRRAVERMAFSKLASCQDWDMCLDALDSHTRIVADDSFYFIKNELSPDRISKQLNKKLLGFMRLGRKHKTFSKTKPLARLYYLHHLRHRLPDFSNKQLNRIYKQHKLAIFFAFIRVEILKVMHSFF